MERLTGREMERGCKGPSWRARDADFWATDCGSIGWHPLAAIDMVSQTGDKIVHNGHLKLRTNADVLYLNIS